VCGVGIVKDYYRFQKFNVMEIANAGNVEGSFRAIEARVREKQLGNET
jgi:tRNA acetyltransferase TAN1